MAYKNFIFNKILLIYSLLILYIIFVSFSYEIEDDFTTTSCYESFSSQKEQFEIFHNNPTGPRFLFAELATQYFSENGRLLNQMHRSFQLKFKKGSCNSSLIISTNGKNFSKMGISVNVNLYYDDPPIAIFLYDFSLGFDPVPLKLVDSKNNFGLYVKFSDYSDEIIEYNLVSQDVKSYLLSLPKDDLICLITEYNNRLIISPKYIGARPNGIITRLKIEYILNENVIDSDHYGAFECQKTKMTDIKTVFLIQDGNKYNIRISVISWKLDKDATMNKIAEISIINSKKINIDKMKSLSKTANILFLIKKSSDYPIYKNRINNQLISESGYIYLVRINKNVEVLKGVKRSKWFIRIENYMILKKHPMKKLRMK